ncbi:MULTISPECIES: transposase domain-containing protein [Blautia]
MSRLNKSHIPGLTVLIGRIVRYIYFLPVIPVFVPRRNWLFAKSIRGADASALVYSITETALLNHLKPYAYLTYILDELRKMGAFPKEEELKKLLPWSKDLPEYCRTKLKK